MSIQPPHWVFYVGKFKQTIFTGSQLPIGDFEQMLKENLITAIK
jgi:hypothetical protein